MCLFHNAPPTHAKLRRIFFSSRELPWCPSLEISRTKDLIGLCLRGRCRKGRRDLSPRIFIPKALAAASWKTPHIFGQRFVHTLDDYQMGGQQSHSCKSLLRYELVRRRVGQSREDEALVDGKVWQIAPLSNGMGLLFCRIRFASCLPLKKS